MKSIERLSNFLGGELGALVRTCPDEILEIRIRCGRPTCIRLSGGEERTARAVNAKELKQMLNRLMENSLYAWESEMRQGYFTVSGGCRVGVCGKMIVERGVVTGLANVGSICIRVPREVTGCAGAILPYVFGDGGLCSALILSPPGLGKTTMLRDLVRQVSGMGVNVAVADERREIAACCEGVPQLDVGPRTDVMDNCPKQLAIPMLIRACAPQLLAVDEIGGAEEAEAIEDAARCGVRTIATAHAVAYRDAENRAVTGRLLRGRVFQWAFLLGGVPGQVLSVKNYAVEDEE